MSNSTSCPDRLAWLVPTYDDVQYDAPITDSPAYVVVQVAPAAAAAFAWGLVEAARSRARARGPVRCAASLALLGVLATSPVAWRFVEVLGCEWDAAERTNTVWCGIAVVAHGALAVLLFATAVRWARRGLVLGLAVASGAAVGGVGLHGWWLDARALLRTSSRCNRRGARSWSCTCSCSPPRRARRRAPPRRLPK